jgi:biotin transport system substrate-specific component
VLAELLPGALARDVALVVGAALLTAACALIVVPLPFSPVPVTGQTFAVLLTAAALGPARGAAGQLLYVALGLVGFPFYADGASGPGVLFGATGGYLVGFVLAGWVVGAAARRGLDRTPRGALPAFLLGSLVIYAVGVPWLAVVAGLGPGEALALGLLPFVPGALAKALLAAGLLPLAWRLVGRR